MFSEFIAEMVVLTTLTKPAVVCNDIVSNICVAVPVWFQATLLSNAEMGAGNSATF